MEDEGFFENLKQGNLGGLGRNLMEGARDEFLGIDDFSRFGRYLSQGDFLKALKSLGAGTVELGGSALMLVPGGQLASLATKGGKAGKVLNMLRALSLQERGLAKTASARGIPRSMNSAAALGIGPELAETVSQSGFKNILKRATDEFGYSRGGTFGSLVRGAGQLTGQLPTSQGPLARGILGGRIRAPYLSGKLGPLAMRTGIDTELMSPFMTDVPQVNPYQQALAEILMRNYYSPSTAY